MKYLITIKILIKENDMIKVRYVFKTYLYLLEIVLF